MKKILLMMAAAFTMSIMAVSCGSSAEENETTAGSTENTKLETTADYVGQMEKLEAKMIELQNNGASEDEIKAIMAEAESLEAKMRALGNDKYQEIMDAYQKKVMEKFNNTNLEGLDLDDFGIDEDDLGDAEDQLDELKDQLEDNLEDLEEVVNNVKNFDPTSLL